MTTPPYQPGPYGQPNQDPYGQQSGGGYGQYGPRPPQQPQYGGQWDPERTEQFDPGQAQQLGQPQQQWPGAQYGGGFQPPEPPKKKTGMVVAIVAIAVLVIAGAGVGLFVLNNKDKDSNNASETTSTTSDASVPTEDEGETTTETESEETTAEEGEAIDAQPGDCIKVNVASSTNADVETVDCSTAEAVYKVGTREETDTGSCPNDQYVQYTEEGQLLLCLQLNVRDGECLEVTSTDDKRADCASPTATHRVAGVFDGVDDETQCAAETTEVITYPQPPLTICLVSPAS